MKRLESSRKISAKALKLLFELMSLSALLWSKYLNTRNEQKEPEIDALANKIHPCTNP